MSTPWRIVALAALFLGLVAAFGPLLSREWHGADARMLDRLPRIESITDLRELLAQAAGPGSSPLTAVALRGMRAASGEEGARPWVATNLVLHALNAMLLLALLARRGVPGAGAVLFALAFALHPLQVATVGGLAGLGEILAGSFVLLALHLRRWRPAGTWADLGVLACFGCGIAASPVALLLPVLLWIPDDGTPLSQGARARLVHLAPLLVAAGLAGAFHASRAARPLAGLDAAFSATDHLHHLGAALLLSTVDLLAPWRLSPLHVVPPPLGPVATLIGLAALILALAFAARRSTTAAAGALWLAATLGLAALRGGQRFGYRSDEWLYFAVPGLAWLVAGCMGRRRSLAALLVVVTWAAMAHEQADHWSTERSWLDRAIAVRPDNWRALTARAEVELDDGDVDAAEADLVAALSSQPRSTAAAWTLARIHALDDDRYATELLISHAEREGWNSPDATLPLGFAFLETGRSREALDLFGRDPSSPDARAGLALACARGGETDEALEHRDLALAGANLSAPATLSLAWLLATAPEERLVDPERALRLVGAVDDPALRFRRLDVEAAALATLGRAADAFGAAQSAAADAQARGFLRRADEIRARAQVYLQSRRWTEPRPSDPALDG